MNTQAPTHHPTRITRAIALLEHLAPAWFAMVMGWCGLSQAWLRASDVFGETAIGLSLVSASFALLIFVVLCIACVIRLSAHPRAVAADMQHPIRHAFMATLPISIMLLATLGINLFWNTSRDLDTALTFVWCVGSVLEIAATVWVAHRWLTSTDKGGLQWATFTPVSGNTLVSMNLYKLVATCKLRTCVRLVVSWLMVRSLWINQKREIRTNLIGLRWVDCIASFLAVVTNRWVIGRASFLLVGHQQVTMA